MKAEEHQCIPTLSDIQGLLEQNAPFLSSVQKRETFPHVSVKFFRSNNGQWEIKKTKKNLRGGGARALWRIARICKDTFYDELILERAFLFDH